MNTQKKIFIKSVLTISTYINFNNFSDLNLVIWKKLEQKITLK